MKLRKIKNKKAMLLPEETLKIIIAALSIIVLMILAYKLYGMFILKTDIEQARATLKDIIGIIENPEKAEERDYLIASPKEWFLISFEDKGELCICPEMDFEVCQKQGTCESVEDIRIDKNCDIQKEGAFKIHPNCISFSELPISIVIRKQEDMIDIFTKERVITENLFSEFLEFKKDENSLSIRKLSKKFIDGEIEKQELKEAVELFFEQKNIYGIFYITRQKSADMFYFDNVPKNIDFDKPQILEFTDKNREIYKLFFNAKEKK